MLKKAQVRWEEGIDPNDASKYEKVKGHTFPLQNKDKSPTEDLLIPFDSAPDMDEDIKNSYYKKVVGTPLECFNAIKANPALSAARDKISSAFILKDGTCVLLVPHGHDEISRGILPQKIIPDTHIQSKAFGMSINSDYMPLYAKALRAQFRPTGLGVTIDMLIPPTKEQIKSIKDYYELTTQSYLVAEIKWNRELLGRIINLESLLLFLSKGFPIENEYTDVPTQIRDYIEETDPVWMGTQKMARNKKKRII